MTPLTAERGATDADATMWPPYSSPTDIDGIEAVPLAARPLPTTTYEAVERAARLWPDSVAAVFLADGARWREGEEITFGELAADVRRTANLLATLGVGRTTAVGLLSPNTAGLVPALLAAQVAGIAAPVNPVLRPDHVRLLLERAAVRVLVAAGPEIAPEVWDHAREVAGSLGLRALLALRPTGSSGPAPALEPVDGVKVGYLHDLAAAHPADELVGITPPLAADLAAYFHTGGTTGTPKLAAHTHAMEVADAWAVAAIGELPDDARLLAALPLFHVNALIVTLLGPLLRGRRVIWAGPLGYRDPALFAAFWQIVEHHRITAMSAVPLVYGALSQVPVDADISSLRMCIVGAAPLPPAVVDGFGRHTGIRLAEGYGLTEATCASCRSFLDHPRAGSVGQRLPYQRIKAVAVDEATGAWTDLPPGSTGTLVISGPVVFPGYVVAQTPDGPVLDTLDKVRGGWLDTGDLGSVDVEGFVRLTGRAKDIIIRGGHNIDPASIEDALRSHPAVTDAGAVGRPDPVAGEVPVAYVTVRDASVSADELRAWAAEQVPEPAAAPKVVTILDVLPVTAVGKPYKPALRLLAARGALAEQLTDAGAALPHGDGWCTDEGGRVRVCIAAPQDEGVRARVTALLDGYDLDWTFM